MTLNTIYHGDSLQVLKTLPDESIDCCITSPPYWGLRDYGTAKWEGGDEKCNHLLGTLASNKSTLLSNKNRDGKMYDTGMPFKQICGKCGAVRIDNQLGLEKTPEEYTAKMVEIFREVKRVLKKEGVMFLNLGDTYSAQRWSNKPSTTGISGKQYDVLIEKETCLPDKNLVGIPWRVAFALQADSWYLRQDIIWHKPNPMPESVTDRCTKAHEYIFLLAKSQKYYFDNKAIKEPAIYGLHSKENRPPGIVRDRLYGYNSKEATLRGRIVNQTKNGVTVCHPNGEHGDAQQSPKSIVDFRNKRSVWTIATKPYKGAHFATFPENLVMPCILAGCPKGGIVLDPFAGSGTTCAVAKRLGRNYIGIELNPAYIKLAEERIAKERTLFNDHHS